MAAVFAPLEEIERILKTIDGYVVIANVNSNSQAVIGGASKAVEQAMEAFLKAGYDAVPLPVSHAFHTSIVAAGQRTAAAGAGAPAPCNRPRLPIVANVNGEFYPTGPDVVPQMLDILAQQVASPVQFVKGLHTLYDAGARVFVEVGPKKALQGFAEDVLGERGDVVSLFTNHPKFGDIAAFNQALCGLYAAGLGRAGTWRATRRAIRRSVRSQRQVAATNRVGLHPAVASRSVQRMSDARSSLHGDRDTPSSAVCSPMFSIAAGRFTAARMAPQPSCPVASPARRWACPEPSTSSMTAMSAASCGASSSSMRSPRASAAPCSTSTLRAW